MSTRFLGLRTGEKRQEVTDLSLASPVGALAFTRSYKQDKRNGPALMGSGWTHNHNLTLTLDTVPTLDTIVIQMPNGGEAHFTQQSVGSSTYLGDAGSSSTISYTSSTQRYTLTAMDKSTFEFDSSGKLVRRAWPQGLSYVWDYTYVSGKLDKVEEFEKVGTTYTSTGRKLVFRYHTAAPYAGLLYRVGDHTFSDTNPSQPTGRYVEFGYTQGKKEQSGSIVDDTALTGYLLTNVRDVRGNLWLYDYYGQFASETDVRQVNFLTRSIALGKEDSFTTPSVVTEEAVYTMTGTGSTAKVSAIQHKRGNAGTELLVNGDMESASSGWSAIGGATSTQVQLPTYPVFTGSYSRSVNAAANAGIQSNTWAMQDNRTYMVTAWVYVSSGSVKMQVSPSQSAFDRTFSTSGVWALLRTVVTPTTAASGLTLQFIANGSSAVFYVDRASVVEVTPGAAATVTDFTFNDGGEEITTEKTANQATTHRFNNGIYMGMEDPAGNANNQEINFQYRPETQRDPNGNLTLLNWSTDGKLLMGVGDALGNQVGFNYTDDKLVSSTDANGYQTTYAYADTTNPRQPTEVKVIDNTVVKRWQKFTYDSVGHTTQERTVDPANDTDLTKDAQRVSRTYVASGNGWGLSLSTTQKDINGANDVITNYQYDNLGRVTKIQRQNMLGSCELSYSVYDTAGNVIASICNYTASTAPTDVASAIALFNPSVPTENRVTVYDYDSLGRRINVTTDAGASYAQIALTVYDAADRVVRTIASYDVSLAPSNPQTADPALFGHGTDNTKNLISDTFYNARGMVRKQVDVLGNVTLFGYDEAGRLVRTLQNASQVTYNNDYNYTDTSPDPSLAAYTVNSAADVDILIINTYDPNGNLVKSTDALGNINFTVYDALNRPIKTVRNAKTTATVAVWPGDGGYVQANDPRSDLYQVSGAQPPSSTITPAELDAYEAAGDPDRDQMERTEYDKLGRVQRTRDAIGNWTLYGYDTLGRQVRVIRNAKTPTYDIAAHPDLGTYSIDTAVADLDLVTDTFYDPQGRVLYTEDKTISQKTWIAYDGLGRQKKTIVNAVGNAQDGGTSDPRSDTYSSSSAADQDLISRTVYDTSGRVQTTEDTLGRKTWYVYDTLGRQIKVIQNCTYVSGSPAPDSPSYIGQHATDTAKDIISQTVYDAQGRVFKTIDSHGTETRYEYDILGRRTKVTTNYVDGVFSSSAPDEDLITTTTYDLAGRGFQITDPAGKKTYRVYDAAGRVIRSVTNYVVQGSTTPKDWYWNGTNWQYSSSDSTLIQYGSANDQNLISVTTYDKLGRVATSVDARRTQTTLVYDGSGRRLKVIQADGTPLAVTSYTCYDKASRVLRTIQNYLPATGDLSPDVKDTNGNFLYAPTQHGANEDQNLIASYTLDKLGRQTAVKDAVSNTTTMNYRKDGQLLSTTDPEGTLSTYRYDKLRRRILTVQSYVAGTFTDPGTWAWDDAVGQKRWEDGSGSAITFGTLNDQNIIVAVTYDKGGRMLSMRDPRGSLTQYTYDLLDRRLTLTNPLSQQWSTVYSETSGTLSRTLPRVVNTDPMSQQAQQDFDYLGRLKTLQYLNESPKLTPDVTFTYDAAGNRTLMTETSGASTIRKTQFNYDLARRLSSVDFDKDGNGSFDETVTYEYDKGGLRTKLTLPNMPTPLPVTYSYDARGRLLSLTDWDTNTTTYTHDNVGRLRSVDRANNLRSVYQYDPASRLRHLSHTKGNQTLGDFAYQVDKRGNRTEATEYVRSATAGSTTILAPVDDFGGSNEVSFITGTWTYNNDFRETTDTTGWLKIPFGGDDITLTMGTGPDHSIYDIYIDGSLWMAVDGCVLPPTRPGERSIQITLADEGPHTLEVRNRAEKQAASSNYKVRFKSLLVNRQYSLYTWNYAYDALSRVRSAAAVAPNRSTYTYNFDMAGNRISQVLSGSSSVSLITYTYDAANRLSTRNDNGTLTTFTYDTAGRLTFDGTNTYMWDRANRLLSMGSSSYLYNGLGQRIQQTASSAVTNYLLDQQPGLFQILATSTSAGTTTGRYVHGPMGLHAQKDANGWEWLVQDGLGSVRGVVNNTVNPLESRTYSPYGEPISSTGTNQTPFGFTGEPTDGNGLVYLRARYYAPSLGVFTGLDPIENGNRYTWVNGNVANNIDPSGMIMENPGLWNRCYQTDEDDCFLCFTLTNPQNQQACLSLQCCKNATDRIKCWNEMSQRYHAKYGITPTPSATGQATDIIFFGGSWGDDPGHQQDPSCQKTPGISDPNCKDIGSIHIPGPDPKSTVQTGPWISIAKATYNVKDVQFPGDIHVVSGAAQTSKAIQAESALSSVTSNTIVIGYSAGADTALMFVDRYVTSPTATGKITGLAVLGPTVSGTMLPDSNGAVRQLGDPGVVKQVLDNILTHGVNVYWLNDKAAGGDLSYTRLPNASGIIRYKQDLTREHWDRSTLPSGYGKGTNNDDMLINDILNWFNAPIP